MTARAMHRQTFQVPREVLLFAALLIAIAITGAAAARWTGMGRAAAPVADAVESLSLRFADQADGSVLVRRASDGVAIMRIAPETNAFMRATMRGLARARQRQGAGDETPFVLTHWSDGRLSLDDPTTGRSVGLEAFGVTNAGAFASLFAASGAVR